MSLEIECEVAEAGRPMQIELVFIDQDGGTLMKVATSGHCPPALGGWPGRIQLNIPFEGGMMTIPKAGPYRFDVLVNGVHLGYERLLFL